MKIVGIVAEYNPFHIGHLYQIQEIKRSRGADAVLVVMSGPFVQRGEPALADKFLRAGCALMGGADMVLELPPAYACGGAEAFARGAIGLLQAAGCVDEVVFGVRGAKTQELVALAERMLEKEEDDNLQEALRSGLSYPAAFAKAMGRIDPAYEALLADPNHILGIEYIKAIRRQGSPIVPVALERWGASHRDADLPSEGPASASAIRRALQEGAAPESLSAYVPPCSVSCLEKGLFAEDISALLSFRLLELSGGGREALCVFAEVSKELASRILSCYPFTCRFGELTERVRSRSFTAARVRRALLHILLGITKEEQAAMPRSLRLLGLRRDSLLPALLKERASLPLLTKMADAPAELAEEYAFAQSLYRQCVFAKYGEAGGDDYRTSPVVAELPAKQ